MEENEGGGGGGGERGGGGKVREGKEEREMSGKGSEGGKEE